MMALLVWITWHDSAACSTPFLCSWATRGSYDGKPGFHMFRASVPLEFFIEYSLDYYAFGFSTGLMRRLAEFRAVNTEDETVMNYFDELEIHPDHIGKCSWLSLIKSELGRNKSKKRITLAQNITRWTHVKLNECDIQGRWNSNPLVLGNITCQGFFF